MALLLSLRTRGARPPCRGPNGGSPAARLAPCTRSPCVLIRNASSFRMSNMDSGCPYPVGCTGASPADIAMSQRPSGEASSAATSDMSRPLM
eukprot:scaffold18613_cov112-Isochrysis_galbana.AAC.6